MSCTLIRYATTLRRRPDFLGKNVKVWRIKQDASIRVNLVEMSGELPLHKHPDADHSLMVLEGRVRVHAGNDDLEIGPGDFVSIPLGVPHKYWPISESAKLVSMDAPYYDPDLTIPLES